ncbi:hypothetical protein Tco_0210996 [Tanacetum coccineum]
MLLFMIESDMKKVRGQIRVLTATKNTFSICIDIVKVDIKIDFEIILQLNKLYKDFVPQKELSAEQTYFSSSSIPCVKDSVKILGQQNYASEVYLDAFQDLFHRDIKEMKDAFEQNDVYLDEIENQNDLLKDLPLWKLSFNLQISESCLNFLVWK